MRYNNDIAANDGAVGGLIFFCFSVLFSATVITWFLFNIYGISVSGIALPNLNPNTEYNFQSDNYTENLLTKNGEWVYTEGIGRVASSDNSFLIFDKLDYSDGTTFVNEYDIQNNGEDYAIILIYTNSAYLEVITKSEGLYIHNTLTDVIGLGFISDKFYPYPNAKSNPNPHIRAEYNAVPSPSNTNLIKYYIDGNLVLNIDSSELVGNIQVLPFTKYYGGVHAIKSGLVVKEFKNVVIKANEDALSAIGNGIAFLFALLKILVWNVDTVYLPWELNVLFIKTQLFAISVCIFAIWRS